MLLASECSLEGSGFGRSCLRASAREMLPRNGVLGFGVLGFWGFGVLGLGF